MLKDLLLFLIMIVGGIYGLWVMRGLDGFIKRSREEKSETGKIALPYFRRITEKPEKRVA